MLYMKNSFMSLSSCLWRVYIQPVVGICSRLYLRRLFFILLFLSLFFLFFFFLFLSPEQCDVLFTPLLKAAQKEKREKKSSRRVNAWRIPSLYLWISRFGSLLSFFFFFFSYLILFIFFLRILFIFIFYFCLLLQTVLLADTSIHHSLVLSSLRLSFFLSLLSFFLSLSSFLPSVQLSIFRRSFLSFILSLSFCLFVLAGDIESASSSPSWRLLQAQKRLVNAQGDHLTLLNVYTLWEMVSTRKPT